MALLARRYLLVAISGLVITQLACSSLLGSGTGGGGGSGFFTDPGNPLDVSLTLDAANAVTQVIALAGGEVSATGADGTRYTLTIPDGVLPGDLEISMTPISAVSGLPFSGGLGGAVLLEPSGLTFADFVTLQIEPAIPIPLEKQVLFGFEEQGEDLHLAIPVDDPGTIQIRLLHFSGAGVASGLSAERAAVMLRQADRAQARLTSRIAAMIQEQRQGGSEVPESVDLTDYFSAYFDTVVLPRLKAAASESGTCAQGNEALATYFGWQTQLTLMGVDEDESFRRALQEYAPVFLKKCLDEAYDRCANKHQVGDMIPALIRTGLVVVKQGLGDEPGFEDLMEYGEGLLQRCFQWELEFESAATLEDGGDGGYDSRVRARVPLRVDLPGGLIWGKSALQNVDFTFKVRDCMVQSIRGGGTFTAGSLSWRAVQRKDDQGGLRHIVDDFYLRYDPGYTSESMTITCQGQGQSMTTPPSPLWTTVFAATHQGELGGADDAAGMVMYSRGVPMVWQEYAFEAQGWRVSEAEQMATKEWQGESQMDGRVFEGGEFRLIHRPQK